MELVDADRQLPIAYRNTIANMMAEAEALNGIFAPDELDRTNGTGGRASPTLPYPPVAARRRTRVYEIDETIDLADVRPMIAKPFSPGNAFPAEEVARERISFDKAMIGSCTNGSYDDLLQAALVLRAARAQGAKRVAREFAIFPGIGRRRTADRSGGSPPRRRVDCRGVSLGRRRDPSVVVRPVLRPGAGRAEPRAAGDHLVQPQLAEPDGIRRRRLSRQPRSRRRISARSGSWRRHRSSGWRGMPNSYGV